jgi:glycine oxidase
VVFNKSFLVIGAGVIGLSSAWELARLGAKVTVLERGCVGAESSWAGGGILFPLLPWDYNEPITALTELSRQCYPGWIDSLRLQTGIDPEYLVSGMRVLPPFYSAQAMAWCAAHGLHIENEGDALWLPDVAQVRNPRLIKALRRSLDLLGVSIVEHVAVSGFRFDRGRVAGVGTNRGDYAANNYIVAAGAWRGILLGDLAPKTPIWPVRGQMLLFKAEAGLLPHILLQDGIYLIPRLDGQILVGSTLEDVGFDNSITEDAQVSLLSKAVAMFPPLGQASLIHHWAGLRPGSPDNVPVIGRHPEIENLYLNAGHFRYGVTMAPASAILLANMIAGKAQPIDVAPYAWR